MKKTYKTVDLDCANCAAKMEEAIKNINGVTFASVSFVASKIVLEAADEDFAEIEKKMIKVCRKIELDCRIIL